MKLGQNRSIKNADLLVSMPMSSMLTLFDPKTSGRPDFPNASKKIFPCLENDSERLQIRQTVDGNICMIRKLICSIFPFPDLRGSHLYPTSLISSKRSNCMVAYFSIGGLGMSQIKTFSSQQILFK
jgi:hypothetical protein